MGGGSTRLRRVLLQANMATFYAAMGAHYMQICEKLGQVDHVPPPIPRSVILSTYASEDQRKSSPV